ncbi:MAG: hypothetical protein P8Z67_08125 [Gammaproteobacteria bacterium]
MKNRLFIILLFTLFGAGSAFANTMGQHEISNAIKQAKMGSKATTLQQVDMHLHRVLNCLEGRKGMEYDAKAGDPCMGKGAMNDFKSGKFGRDELQQAMEDAHYGLMTKRVSIAQNAADLAIHSLSSAKDD